MEKIFNHHYTWEERFSLLGRAKVVGTYNITTVTHDNRSDIPFYYLF